jgi:hypothetical protein
MEVGSGIAAGEVIRLKISSWRNWESVNWKGESSEG